METTTRRVIQLVFRHFWKVLLLSDKKLAFEEYNLVQTAIADPALIIVFNKQTDGPANVCAGGLKPSSMESRTSKGKKQG